MREAMVPLRLRDLLHVAHRDGASDIHIAPGARPATRVHGRLRYLEGAPIEPAESAALLRTLLGDRRCGALVREHDVTGVWCDRESGVAVRVHAYTASDGICIALRLLRARAPSLDELGLPAEVARLASCERGLIVLAGPTGCGKSSTLAEIARARSCRIVTFEDPIEYRHESDLSMFTQREVGRDVESFASAVLGALRADPDVIAIGEMRDPATMRAALVAAETGHLVLTTLHTGTAAQTVDRVVDAFDGAERAYVRAQLAQSLAAVVCQRLVARAPGGGRRPVVEVLVANDAVRAMIREGRVHQLGNAIMTARHEGMMTFAQHAGDLLARREIDGEIAARL